MADGAAADQAAGMSAFLDKPAPARRAFGQSQKSGKGQQPTGAGDHRGASNKWGEQTAPRGRMGLDPTASALIQSILKP